IFSDRLLVFFFNDTATTEIYTLSLHDALPISRWPAWRGWWPPRRSGCTAGDRKSTRLNSSHVEISYAVFCLKKKKTYYTRLDREHSDCTPKNPTSTPSST